VTWSRKARPIPFGACSSRDEVDHGHEALGRDLAHDARHRGEGAQRTDVLVAGGLEGAAGLLEAAELEQRLAERELAVGVARVDGGCIGETPGGARSVAATSRREALLHERRPAGGLVRGHAGQLL
jgi:hypothetical protein